MKVFMVIVLIIASTFIGVGSESYDATYQNIDVVTFYTTDKDITVKNATVTDSKIYREVKCDVKDAFGVAETLRNVDGVSVLTTKSEKNVLSLLKATVVSRRNVNGINIVYAYSELIPFNTTVDGKVINIEIADSGCGKIIAGCPVILGSY